MSLSNDCIARRACALRATVSPCQLSRALRFWTSMMMADSAAAYDGRFVTVGPIALFSTDTGDAWLLNPAISNWVR